LALEQAIAKLQENQTALDFNLSEYNELQLQYQQLQRQQQQLLENRQHTQHQIELLTRDLALWQKQEQEYQAKKLELANAQNQYLFYETLDRSFTDLRQYLTQQIRPQLSEIASLLLAELTDGRYSALELDDGYNVAVIESGDRKSVISGGEEDIVNLCLRLAVSQMIMERTGQPFSLLILDEVFGSLDEQRRDNVLQLLHKLGNQFKQVLVISHIDLIKESLNHAICLEYLPREQYSCVVVQ
jgi:ATPase involved in DNA repair